MAPTFQTSYLTSDYGYDDRIRMFESEIILSE